MADSKISQLPDGDSTATTASVVAGAVSGVTKKISISKILSLLDLSGFALIPMTLKTSCTQAPDATVVDGQTHTFDFNAGSVQKVTKTGSGTVTFNFANIPANTFSTYVIILVNGGNGTILLPTHLKAGGIALTFTASGQDRIVCQFDKDGVLSMFVDKDWKV